MFEAALRGLAVSLALHASSMSSQGAISEQIQQQLRAKLFVCSGLRIELTLTGRTFAHAAESALDTLFNAVEAVAATQREREARYVRLSMLPSIAAKWLAPRLGTLASEHPEIDLQVSTSREFVSFEIDEVDIAIRYGEGTWSGTRSVLLAYETVSPVCTQSYAHRMGLSTPCDLLRATLLHADIDQDRAAWFSAAGGACNDAPHGSKYLRGRGKLASRH